MWNQWSAQSTAYPPAAAAVPTTAPPSGGFPMGYPFYPTSAIPPTSTPIPGYAAAQQWSMPQQQQQWQQWEQWQQQYAQWQQQYGDKYQAQMMMGGIPPLPAQGGDAANPPLPVESKEQHLAFANKNVDNSSSNLAFSQSGTQEQDTAKRPLEHGDDSQQVLKKARENVEDLSEAEKAFDVQFKNWEEQFLKWKEQNSNHPDKSQYKEYEAKWESWREQLVQRREQMRKKRETKSSDDNKVASSDNTSTRKVVTSPTPHVQKQIPPPVLPGIPPTPNPLAMQGMGFPTFSNPPPIVQNPVVQSSLGFPGFGSQYPSFPTQPPAYNLPPSFPTQSMFPGMNMMCPPPAIAKPLDLLNSPISQQSAGKKDAAINNPGEKSKDINFLNKGEDKSKGIPGLDLAESGTGGKGLDDKLNQAASKLFPPQSTGPLQTPDDAPFNFPPPQKQHMGFPGPSNMPFGPPGFNSPLRGQFPGSYNQPFSNQSQNKFGPQNTQPPNKFGPLNTHPPNNFGQQNTHPPNNFGQQNTQSPNKFGPQNTQPPNKFGPQNMQLLNKFGPQNTHGLLADKNFVPDRNQSGFNSQFGSGIPNLMDGFDPSKGPPSFGKKIGGNLDDNYQDDDQADEEYDEYDGSRFENPWDNYDENDEPELNKSFGNNANKPEDNFGPKGGSFGGGFNKGSERYSEGSRGFGSQDFDNFSAPKSNKFPERGPDNMDEKGKFGPKSDGPAGRVFGRGKPSRFDTPYEDRFSGPEGHDSPHDENLGDRNNQHFSKQNEPDNFKQTQFSNNETFPDSRGLDRFTGPTNRFGGPGSNDRFSGPGPNNRFSGPGSNDRFCRPGSNDRFSGPGPNDRFSGPGPNDRFGGFGPNDRFSGPGANDRYSGSGNLDSPKGAGHGRFNNPDHFPSIRRGPNDPLEEESPVFRGDIFGRNDRATDRDEGNSGNHGRPKGGLLPHPGQTTDHNKIPPLMSLKKPGLLPIPGRPAGTGPNVNNLSVDSFPSRANEPDNRKLDAPATKRNEPLANKKIGPPAPETPSKDTNLPPFPHEMKKNWEGQPQVQSVKEESNKNVIDYNHISTGDDYLLSELSVPEAVEPMQVFDYNHGANPGPQPYNDDWRNNTDKGMRGRDRGRDDRDIVSRGRNWEDDRNRPRERERSRDRDWKKNDRDRSDRDRNDRDRMDRGRNERDRSERDRNDRDRIDRDRIDRERNDRDRSERDKIDKRERDRDRTDKERDRREDRKDEKKEEKDNKENRSSGPIDKRGGPRDRNQHDKFKDDSRTSSKNDKNSSKEEASQKGTTLLPAVLIEDILNNPGRNNRPAKIVVILRGIPGSGKTYVAKLIKDKEVEMGGSAPRILSLDDYFMVEIEKEETDAESGKTVKNKIMEYEYEAGMESSYRHSLIKALRKTILDGYFPFIIIDCVHEKIQHYEEIYTFAKQKGFQVYICEMDNDLSICSKRNVHKRTEKELDELIKNWEPTPSTQTILDVRSLLQSAAITEVDMEDTTTEDIEMKAGDISNKEEDKSEEDNAKPEETVSTDSQKQEKPTVSATGFNFQKTTTNYRNRGGYQGRGRGFGGPIWRRGANRRR